MWCVPVGALAGVGLIEFNWGGPPYDGGFLGDLILFGGFLALGQALFVAVFVLALCGWAAEQTGCVAVLSALAWSLVGFVGWTMGSYFEVGLATPLYSNLSVLAGVLPWLFVGVLEGIVLMAALASVGKRRATGDGGARSPETRERSRMIPGLIWVLASTVGGLFYEYWASFDIAAGQNRIKDAIGSFLEGAGVAENVAFEVVPNALVVPILYGIPTGLALVVIRRSLSRES